MAPRGHGQFLFESANRQEPARKRGRWGSERSATRRRSSLNRGTAALLLPGPVLRLPWRSRSHRHFQQTKCRPPGLRVRRARSSRCSLRGSGPWSEVLRPGFVPRPSSPGRAPSTRSQVARRANRFGLARGESEGSTRGGLVDRPRRADGFVDLVRIGRARERTSAPESRAPQLRGRGVGSRAAPGLPTEGAECRGRIG